MAEKPIIIAIIVLTLFLWIVVGLLLIDNINLRVGSQIKQNTQNINVIAKYLKQQQIAQNKINAKKDKVTIDKLQPPSKKK